MARSVSSSLQDQSGTLRQLKLVVLILVLSNIALGAYSFYLLRSTDRTYTELIRRSVPLLNQVQTVTAEAARAFRGTNFAGVAGTSSRRTERLNDGRRGLARDEEARAQLLKAGWPAESSPEWVEFKGAGEAFAKVAQQVLAEVAGGRIEESVRLREENLRPAFERYLSAATKISDWIETESLRANENASAKTGSMSTIVLGLASWPVMLLAGLLVLTAVFVLVLMVLFRGREMNDMP